MTIATRSLRGRAALNGVPLVSPERASRALRAWGAMFPVLRPGTSGWVYIAWRRGGLVKLGFSQDPALRIAQIEDGFYLDGEAFPVVLIGPCHRKAEYVVNQAIARFRMKRECFDRRREVFHADDAVLELGAMLRAAAESCFYDNRFAERVGQPKASAA